MEGVPVFVIGTALNFMAHLLKFMGGFLAVNFLYNLRMTDNGTKIMTRPK